MSSCYLAKTPLSIAHYLHPRPEQLPFLFASSIDLGCSQPVMTFYGKGRLLLQAVIFHFSKPALVFARHIFEIMYFLIPLQFAITLNFYLIYRLDMHGYHRTKKVEIVKFCQNIAAYI